MLSFQGIWPVLRIFDYKKAVEFYCDYLGCSIDWEHRFEKHMPVYMQVSRENFSVHLSEHHGDATPGSCQFVLMQGVKELHKELQAKDYPYLNPGLEETPWKHLVLQVKDPFGNTLRFSEALEQDS